MMLLEVSSGAFCIKRCLGGLSILQLLLLRVGAYFNDLSTLNLDIHMVDERTLFAQTGVADIGFEEFVPAVRSNWIELGAAVVAMRAPDRGFVNDADCGAELFAMRILHQILLTNETLFHHDPPVLRRCQDLQSKTRRHPVPAEKPIQGCVCLAIFRRNPAIAVYQLLARAQ